MDERPEADPTAPTITELLIAWRDGDPHALDRLMPRVYQELHAIAEGYLRRERRDHTLQPTAVLHEAYLRMVDKSHPRWQSRVHFFTVAAQLMRRILVDHARSKKAGKRGGTAVIVPLEEADAMRCDGARQVESQIDLLALDEALERLAAFDARKGRVIELRYFGGLTVDETSEVLGVSRETVALDTRLARAWLLRELGRGAHA